MQKPKLNEAIIPFKEKEIEIGNRITVALNITKNKQQMVLGACPVCGKGSLKIIKSRRTKKRFVGCSNYSSGVCKATAPLPQKGSIRTTGEMSLHADGQCSRIPIFARQNIDGNFVLI